MCFFRFMVFLPAILCLHFFPSVKTMHLVFQQYEHKRKVGAQLGTE